MTKKTIIDFLPKESPVRIETEKKAAQFEQTFKLAPGSSGVSSQPQSSSKTTSSSTKKTTSSQQPQQTTATTDDQKQQDETTISKPSASTTAMQIREDVSSQDQGTWSEATTRKFFGAPVYKQGFLESTKQAGIDILQGNFRGAVESFQLSEKTKGDKIIYTPQFGTLQYDTRTGTPITGFQTQRDIELAKLDKAEFNVFIEQLGAERRGQEAFTTSQARIDSGEDFDKVTTDYNKQVNEINRNFSKRQNEIMAQSDFDASIVQRTDTTRKVIAGVETAGIIGSGFISPSIPTAYMISRGIISIATPTKKGDIIAEGGLFAIGQDVETKRFKEDSPLFKSELSKRREGAIFLALGALSIPGMAFREGRAALQPELVKLGTQKVKFGQVTAGTEKGTFMLKGVQRSGNLQRDIEVFGKFGKDQSGKDILIGDAKGTGVISGTFDSRLPIGFTSGFGEKRIIAQESFTVGLKGQPTIINDLFVTQGKAVVSPTFQVGSIFDMTDAGKVRPISNFVNVGGRGEISFPTGTAIPTSDSQTFKVFAGDTRFTKDLKPTGQFNIDAYGFMTTVDSPTAAKGFTSFQGGGKKSSADFLQGLYQQQGTTALTGQQASFGGALLSSSARTQASIQTQSFGLGFSPSAFAGTGQYEQTITQQTRGIIQPQALTPALLSDQKQDTFITSSFVPRTSSAGRLSSRNVQIPNVAQIPRQDLTTRSIMKTATRLSPPPLIPIIRTPPIRGGGGGGGIPPFKLPKPFGLDRFVTMGDLGGKRKYSYIPSFKAIVFGIRGKQPKKKSFTGLELRPITGGSVFRKGGRRRRNNFGGFF